MNLNLVCLIISQGCRLFYGNGSTKRLQELIHIVMMKNAKRKRLRHNRVNMYEEVITHYLHEDFKSHFRMSRTAVALLLTICETENSSRKNIGRPQVPLKLQCLICIWVLANQESYRSIADRFNVAKSSVFHCLIKVSFILNKKAAMFIKWPTDQEAIDTVAGFKKKRSFPGVLGAIDGCHVNISSPAENAMAYINRKGRCSVILQAVCNHNCLFTDCFIGFPGSVHDARVFQRSRLSTLCNEDYFPYNSHLLGDSAYPLQKHLLTPFRDNGHLTRMQTKYNVCHASTRSIIERAFGLLKGRWRRLNYLELHNSHHIPYIVMAACVLHNFCILQNEETPEIVLIERESEPKVYDISNTSGLRDNGTLKRNDIMHQL